MKSTAPALSLSLQSGGFVVRGVIGVLLRAAPVLRNTNSANAHLPDRSLLKPTGAISFAGAVGPKSDGASKAKCVAEGALLVLPALISFRQQAPAILSEQEARVSPRAFSRSSLEDVVTGLLLWDSVCCLKCRGIEGRRRRRPVVLFMPCAGVIYRSEAHRGELSRMAGHWDPVAIVDGELGHVQLINEWLNSIRESAREKRPSHFGL